jgi:hypothetical protein
MTLGLFGLHFHLAGKAQKAGCCQVSADGFCNLTNRAQSQICIFVLITGVQHTGEAMMPDQIESPQPTRSISVESQTSPLRRFVLNSLVVWPMLGIYMLINQHQPGHPMIVTMPSWVPFHPAFVIFYVGMLLTTWLLPVAIHEPTHFRACLIANICGYLLVMPWWLIIPTVIPRPPLPPGAWAGLVGLLWGIDQPNNVMPCAHDIGPIVAAWFVARERPAWRWPLVAWSAVGLASIAFTWQHRPVDILLGSIAAAIGIALAKVLVKEKTGFHNRNKTFA